MPVLAPATTRRVLPLPRVWARNTSLLVIHTRGFCRCICKRLCLNVLPVVSSAAHKGYATLASARIRALQISCSMCGGLRRETLGGYVPLIIIFAVSLSHATQASAEAVSTFWCSGSRSRPNGGRALSKRWALTNRCCAGCNGCRFQAKSAFTLRPGAAATYSRRSPTSLSCKSRQGTFTQRPHLALSSLPSTTTSTPRGWSRFYTRPTWLFLATRLGTEWVPGFGLGPRHNPEIPLEPYIDMV